MAYLTIQLTDEQSEELRREMYCPECGESRVSGWSEGGSMGNGTLFGSGAWQSECRNGHKWNGTQSFSLRAAMDGFVENGALVMRPVDRKTKFDLDVLLAGITAENLHDEVSTGASVGNEF